MSQSSTAENYAQSLARKYLSRTTVHPRCAKDSIVGRLLFVTADQASETLEPDEEALHIPVPFETPQLALVLVFGFFRVLQYGAIIPMHWCSNSMSSGSESYAQFSIVRLRFSSMDIDFIACSTSVTSCAELPATLKTKGRPGPPATTSFTPSPRLVTPTVSPPYSPP